MSFFDIFRFSMKEVENLPSKDELLEKLINASEKPSEESTSRNPAEIASLMQKLYTQMQKGEGETSYRYDTENIFKELASSIDLKKDPSLYDMCLAICNDIDNSPVEQEFAYHNKQHFTEAMVNCYVLGQVKGLDDATIGKLLFTALIHDFRYPGKNLPAKYTGPSKIERYSCDKAKEHLVEDLGFAENAVQEQLNFSRAIIATTDIFSPATKELVEAIKGGELDTFNSGNDFLNESAQYFIENSEAIESMNIMLDADILSSSVLKELSQKKNELVLNGEIGLGFTDLVLLQKQLEFLDTTAASRFKNNHVFSEQFENTKNFIVKMIEDAEKKMIKDAECKSLNEAKKGYFRPAINYLRNLLSSVIDRSSLESCLKEKQLPTPPFDSGIKPNPKTLVLVPIPHEKADTHQGINR